MPAILPRRPKPLFQYLSSLGLVFLVAAICFPFNDLIGYRVVAFILLLAVSIAAVIFDIRPVLLMAASTAFTWNFFFIPPRFTLHVGNTEDRILFIMFFVVAMVNAVLTYRIRQVEKLARKKEARANTIRLYNTMLNSLSHELRTPIATIIGATDHLQTMKKENESQEELVNEISRAALRLNRQVENLLNMSRLESGFIQPRPDWCDIQELVFEVVKQVQQDNENRKIRVVVDSNLPLFKTDPLLIEHILYNLVNNAVIHSGSGTDIEVSAGTEGRMMVLGVKDNGRGFPAGEMENVFDKFYRLNNSTATGTGLGLSIVKGFAEALGGNVTLQSEPGRGSEFIVSIPAPMMKPVYEQ